MSVTTGSPDFIMIQALSMDNTPRAVFYLARYTIQGKVSSGQQNKLYWEVKERVGRR